MAKKVFSTFSVTTTIGCEDAAVCAERQARHSAEPVESGSSTSFEDAVRLTGHGMFNHLLLLVCGMTSMAAVMEVIGISYVLPSAGCDLELSQADKGLLGAVAHIGVICSSHMWGVLADTTGRRRIVVIALLADVVVSLCASLAPNFATLVVFRFLNGVCVAAPNALCYTLIGEFSSPSVRNNRTILVSFFSSWSAIIVPGLAWSVLPMQWSLPLYGDGLAFTSWRLLLLVCACPALLSGLCLLWFPESPKFLLAVGRREEALQVLARVHYLNTGSKDFPVRELTEDTSSIMASTTDRSFLSLMKIVAAQTAPLFQPSFLLHTFLVCFIQFGNLASAGGLILWLPELFNYQARYAKTHPGAATMCEAVSGVLHAARNTTMDSEALSSIRPEGMPKCSGGTILPQVYVNALIMGGARAISSASASLIVNRVGKLNLLICCMWMAGASAVAINFVGSYQLILALACVVIGVTGMCVGHLSGIVLDLYPTNLRGMAVGLTFMCGRVGSMASSLIVGSLLNSYCDAAFYFLGGLLLACGVLGCFLPKQGRFAT